MTLILQRTQWKGTHSNNEELFHNVKRLSLLGQNNQGDKKNI